MKLFGFGGSEKQKESRSESHIEYPKESRSESPFENPNVSLSDAAAWDAMFGSSWRVGTESALNLATVYRCVDIISSWVGVLPKSVYRKSNGSREKLGDHPVSILINKPCEYLNGFQFEKQLMVNALLRGNGYARIWRDGYYSPEYVEFYESTNVEPFLFKGKKYYRIFSTGEVVGHYDMLHLYDLGVKAYVGKSKIAMHRENLQLTANAQSFGADFFEKGTTVGAYLSFTQGLSDAQIKTIGETWRKLAVGKSNNHNVPVLPFSGELKRTNMPMEDAQFIETRKFQKGEIATIFGVPPHLVGDMENAKYNNVEQMNTAFYQYTLLPWITLLEKEYAEKFLSEKEKKSSYYIKSNVRAMLRGDIASQTQHYKEMVGMGVYSPNDVREFEDLDGFDGGDVRLRPLNMVAINEETNTYIPNFKGDAGAGNGDATANK